MLTRKLLILVVVTGAFMALAGCKAMYQDLKHDIKVLRGEAEAGETIIGNSAAVKSTAVEQHEGSGGVEPERGKNAVCPDR